MPDTIGEQPGADGDDRQLCSGRMETAFAHTTCAPSCPATGVHANFITAGDVGHARTSWSKHSLHSPPRLQVDVSVRPPQAEPVFAVRQVQPSYDVPLQAVAGVSAHDDVPL